VNDSTLFLQSTSISGVVPTDLSASPDGQTLTLTPTTALLPQTVYSVRTSPTIVSTNVNDGVTDVPLNTALTYVLDEPIDEISVEQDAVQLSAGGSMVDGLVLLGADDVTLSFMPFAPLTADS